MRLSGRQGRGWRQLGVALMAVLLVTAPGSAGAAAEYSFDAPVYDIEAAPDGSILVADGAGISEIRHGEIRDVIDVPVIAPSVCEEVFPYPGCVNGIAAVGRGSMFATSGALDQAAGAGLWHVSRGGARLVGDIEAFERTHDPDAFVGPQWKNTACEEDPAQGFTAGPQSNPYHVATLSGSRALVADAAGNTVLAGSIGGGLELVAVLTPPVDEHGDFRVLFELNGIDCYVQPVPTSVAVGPDGAYYVGELTGAPGVPGWSRIWRIEPGARNAVCPSDACTVAFDSLTAVIDVAFGPDGHLYAVEYHAAGWLAAFSPDPDDHVGGTIQRCDLHSGECVTAADGLRLPSAITFDRSGTMWLLENNVYEPTVRAVGP